jgi:putative nucleotidyltransferase with HDIG domain
VTETDVRISAAPAPPPEQVLAHLDALPVLPPIALRLLALTASEQSAAADVTALLSADAALAAKLLAVANSAAVGARTPVTTLERAIVLLGFSAIRSLVLTLKLFECFPPASTPEERRGFDRREFWKHCLAAGCAARRIAAARRELGVDPEEAYAAGLLHDIGKLALDAVYPRAYGRIAAAAERARGEIADVERGVLGIDHTIAGRRVAERWRLPRPLVEAVWLHHLAADALPASAAAPRLIAIVQLADTLVREQRIGHSGNFAHYERSGELGARLGLSEEALTGILPYLVAEVAAQAEWLGLDRAAPEAQYVKSLLGANAELGRLNAELERSGKRLAAGARCFRAICEFDQRLAPECDAGEVVAAICSAAAIALQRRRLAAFGICETGTAVDLCWGGAEGVEQGRTRVAMSPELRAWLDDQGQGWPAVLVRAPYPVRVLLAPVSAALGAGEAWLLPIVHQRAVTGGIAYLAEGDEAERLAGESDDLRSFLAGLGLALGRANAQAAARRLADDLADTNRRLQQMQAELLRSRTLSMIAEMAAGAGHELNSPLTVISGRAQMLLRRLEDPEQRRALELIHDKAHECSRIVTELMDFARPRAPQFEAVPLPELFAALRTEWAGEAPGAGAQLVIDVPIGGDLPGRPDAAPIVRGDRAQLAQVFRELLRNAADAIGSQPGRIVITLRRLPCDELEVLVRDTGCGMPPTVLERAFDPFYSHRAAGRSRGLGLARAHRIIEAHGGRIWLESRPNQGCTAHVVLPAGKA